MNYKYETLMEFFKDIKLDYKEQNNSTPYIDSVLNARKYIDNIKNCVYKNIPDKIPTFISKNNKELYRPISSRQSYCLTKCVQYSCCGEFTNAMNELMDALDDYGKYKQKSLISINECLLFSSVLDIMHEKMIQNQ